MNLEALELERFIERTSKKTIVTKSYDRIRNDVVVNIWHYCLFFISNQISMSALVTHV